jgi:uncharacterized membrane protein
MTIPLLINFLKFENLCLNGYDIGIYYEALLRVDPPQVLNPHLHVRGIKAFNDHFNPALIPVAQFLKIFGEFSPLHMIIFEWLIWILALALLFYFVQDWKLGDRLIALLLFATAKGALTPLYFPVHVDFWAFPFWILMIWSLYKERWSSFLICLFAICFFKESYPIAFLLTGVAFLGLRQWKIGLSILAFCGSFTYWNLILRPLYLGPIHGHGTKMLKEILSDPAAYLPGWWERFALGSSIEIYLVPFALLGAAFFRNRASGLILLSSILPLFGLQFIAGQMESHYPYPMMAAGFTSAIATGVLSDWVKERRRLILLLIFSALPGLSMHFNSTSLFWLKDSNCQFIPTKRAEFQTLKSLIEQEERVATTKLVIGATGGLTPNLISINRDLRHLASFSLIAEHYDLLAFETGPVSFAWPLSSESIFKIQQACTTHLSEELFKGEHFTLWKGKFPAMCVNPWGSGAPNAGDFGPYRPWGQ